MELSEVTKLLVFVGSVEGREAATKLQLAAWADLLEGTTFEQAMRAAKDHYLNESRRLWPADILNWRDAQAVSAERDFEQIGLVLSQQLWVNASILPVEEVERLGRVSVERPEEFTAWKRRLTLQFQLAPRTGELGR